MTVSAQTPIKRSTANGVTTVFPYDFKILAAADLEVSLDGVVKTLTTDYTLSGVGDDAGGNVTMLSAPANGVTVVRRRNMAYTREVDYQDQGELPTDTLDDDQDAPILMIQQLNEEVGRGLRLPITASGASAILPTPAALEVIRWNASATALESFLIASVGSLVVTPFMQDTFLLTATAAAARSAISAASSGAATASGLTMATSHLLGRTTASTGAVEEIAIGAGLSMASGVLSAVSGYMLLQHQLASGTDGGSAAAGVNTRPLNTTAANTIAGASLTANQFTLPAGTFELDGIAAAYASNVNKAYFYNVTSSLTYMGINQRAASTGGSGSLSRAQAFVVLAAPAVFELRHEYQSSAPTNGLGVAQGSGSIEVYAIVSVKQRA